MRESFNSSGAGSLYDVVSEDSVGGEDNVAGVGGEGSGGSVSASAAPNIPATPATFNLSANTAASTTSTTPSTPNIPATPALSTTPNLSAAPATPATPNMFSAYHSVVVLLYFLVLLLFAMCVMQPAYELITFAGAFCCGVCLRGWRGVLRGLLWQAPLVFVFALINPLFVQAGSTQLLQLGPFVIYAESLLYGVCQGLLLVNTLLIFMNASSVLTSDKVLTTLGNALPTVGLMTSMTMRLVPQFAQRGRMVSDAARATTAAAVNGRAGQRRVSAKTHRARRRLNIQEYLRLSTVLMGWGMEDSLESAQAMQVRGWGAAPKRNTYAAERFRRRDALACVVVLALALSSTAAALAACSQWNFYPVAASLAPWFSYAPYVFLAFVPGLLELRERLLWS